MLYNIVYSIMFNDTHREKLCFTQFSTTMAAWLLLTLLLLIQLIKFYTFYYHVLKSTDV